MFSLKWVLKHNILFNQHHHGIAKQSGILLPAAIYKHNSVTGGEEKRSLLTEFPILGEWGLLSSKPISLTKYRNPLVSKQNEIQTHAQRPPSILICPSGVQGCYENGSLCLQLQVCLFLSVSLSLSLSLSVVCTCGAPLPHHSFIPLLGLGCTATSLQPVMQGSPSVRPWCSRLLTNLEPAHLCSALRARE